MTKNVVMICMDCVRRDYFPMFDSATCINSFPQLAQWLSARTQCQVIPALSCASCTLPSIASVFTGLLPSEHRVDPVYAPRLQPEMSLISKLPMNCYGVSANAYISETFGFQAGFEQWIDLSTNTIDFSKSQMTSKWTVDGNLINEAVSDLTLREPFFLYVHYMDAHAPVNMKYANDVLPESLADIEDHRRGLVWRYLVGLRGLDENIHKLLVDLEKQTSDTTYLLFADHGEELCAPPYFRKGHSNGLTQTLLQVPLVIVGKEIRYRNYFSLSSMLPWIMAECDSDIVFGTKRHIAQLLPPKRQEWDRRIEQCVSVTENKLKYILELTEDGDSKELLFDLSVDPKEWVNLIDLRREDVHDLIECAQQQIYILDSSMKDSEIPNVIRERLQALGYI